MNNWLSRLLTSSANSEPLSEQARQTLAQWAALPDADLGRAHFETRYVVINTEASGLDLDKDRVLAVSAVGVDGGIVAPQDSYYAVLGEQPVSALTGLLQAAGKAPLVVFNSAFNRTMLERALEEHLGLNADWLWIDLYFILPALFPERIERPARLADWMSSFGIETFQRHHALGDGWAIAQLFLAAQARALAQSALSPRGLAELERSYRQYRRKV